MSPTEKSIPYSYKFHVYASVGPTAFSELLHSDFPVLRSYLSDENGKPVSRASEEHLHLLVLGAEQDDDLSSLLGLLIKSQGEIREVIVLSDENREQPPKAPAAFQDTPECMESCFSPFYVDSTGPYSTKAVWSSSDVGGGTLHAWTNR